MTTISPLNFELPQTLIPLTTVSTPVQSSHSILMFPTILCHLFSVCAKHVPPQIADTSMKDAVVLIGQDAEFICKVEHLGRHKVAFVRAGIPPRVISYDEKIFQRLGKYELRPRTGPQSDEWALIIKNAQDDDRGNYTCQVNTDPVTAVTAELDLRIPPSVSRSTPSAVEVREGHNVTLSCKADGTPEPSVIWRRQDRQIIRFNGATGYGATIFKGPQLHLTKVSRKHMSEYVCVASNGIPPDESWTVKLLVTFPPIVLPKHSLVRAAPKALARLVCDAESWPRPEITWEKDGRMIFDSDQYAISQTVSGQYHSVHILEIRHVEPKHYGNYRCIAKNDNGVHHADIVLEEVEQDFQYTNSVLSEEPETASATATYRYELMDQPIDYRTIRNNEPGHHLHETRHTGHDKRHPERAQTQQELKQDIAPNTSPRQSDSVLSVIFLGVLLGLSTLV